MLEMTAWSAKYDEKTNTPPNFLEMFRERKRRAIRQHSLEAEIGDVSSGSDNSDRRLTQTACLKVVSGSDFDP